MLGRSLKTGSNVVHYPPQTRWFCRTYRLSWDAGATESRREIRPSDMGGLISNKMIARSSSDHF